MTAPCISRVFYDRFLLIAGRDLLYGIDAGMIAAAQSED